MQLIIDIVGRIGEQVLQLSHQFFGRIERLQPGGSADDRGQLGRGLGIAIDRRSIDFFRVCRAGQNRSPKCGDQL